MTVLPRLRFVARPAVAGLLAAGALLLAGAAGPLEGQEARTSDRGGVPRTLTLEEAVSLALDRNRMLADARLGFEAAEERVTEARSQVFFPQLRHSLRYVRNITAPPVFLPAAIFDPEADPGELVQVPLALDNQWSYSLSVEQPLLTMPAYFGVRTAERHRALRAEVVRGQEHEVVARVRSIYYDLLLTAEEERLAESSLARVRDLLAETRALRQAGMASDYDVLRLEVELASLEPMVERARNAHRQGLRNLAVEVGVEEAPEDLEVAGSLAGLMIDDLERNTPENRAILAFAGRIPEEDGAGGLSRQAQEARSTIRQLELEREISSTELRAARAEFLPRISLFGSYDVEAQQDGAPSFFGSSDQRGYGRLVGLQFSMPLFTGFQRTARSDRVQTELRQSTERLALLREQTDAEVRSLVEQIEEVRHLARARQAAMVQAQRAYRSAAALHREGLASRMELTDAQLTLRESELRYAEAVHGYLVARARLDVVTGRTPAVPRR